MNYLPPGPTPLIFALLAQYHASIPSVYKFRVLIPLSLSDPQPEATPALQATRQENEPAITVSDKIYVYIVAIQLAFCQPPGSLLGAAIGWIVGYAWRAELLPWGRWRWPLWMFEKRTGREGYEGLRRVARGEDGAQESGPSVGAGEGTAAEGAAGATGRPLSTQILDQFRGGF